MGVGEEVRLAGWGVSVQFTKMGGVRKEQREGFWLAKVVWQKLGPSGAAGQAGESVSPQYFMSRDWVRL